MKPWFSSSYINWRRTWGAWQVEFSWRRNNGLMGRFGGGWNWNLGIQIGGTTVLLNLLFCRFSVRRIRES